MRIRLKHDRLAALLAESHRSQNHWALRLGLSRGHLSDIVNGRHPYVSAKTRARLLDTLDVPFDELFEIETPPSAVGARETDPVAQAKLLSTPIAPPPHSPPGGVMSGLLDDLRYAWRLAGRKPIASAAVIMTLALGVSVTAAVFSIVNGLLLKPLPFEESDRVVRLSPLLRSGNSTIMNALPDLEDYRRATSLSAVSGVFLSGATLTEGDAPHQYLILYVDHGYDDVFRIRPAAGRFFVPDEYRFDAPRVVMLSQELWRQQFGGDPTMVGHAVSINNELVTVVGILPPMPYTYPSFPDVGFIAPLRPVPNSSQGTRGALWLRAAARLKPGVTIDQAQSEIATIAASIARAFPEAAGGRGVRLESLHGVETRDVGAMLGLLSVTVAAVMLIACVNVANLLLGQAAARSGEFAVRAALGAGSWRLHRQIVTECSFLAAIGGAFGLAVTPVLTRTLLTFDPDTLPRVGEIGMDGRVLIVGIGMALAAGVAASMPIVRRALSRDLSRDLRQGGRAGSIRGQRRTGRVLIASQVAMSVALLFAATLLLRTLHTLQTTDPGFTSADITTFQVIAPSARYPALRDAQRYLREASQALLALPGVSAIATASEMPYTGNAEWNSFVIRERGDRGRDNPQIRVATVSPNYWDMLGVPLKSGRVFLNTDTDSSPRVAVINETAAARFYAGQQAVGRLIEFNGATWQIIGVVGPMRMSTVAEPPEPELYLSSRQDLDRGWYICVESHHTFAPSVADIRRVLRKVDPTIAVSEAMTMDERVARAVAPQRFRATLVASLCAIALGLSALGIYGVLTDAMSRQTREIGIRLALGEDPAGVQRAVMRSALWTVGFGALIGVGLALLAGRGLAGFLTGVRPTDPVALGGSVFALAIWAAAAAFLPARRASRIDPLMALRHE